MTRAANVPAFGGHQIVVPLMNIAVIHLMRVPYLPAPLVVNHGDYWLLV